MLLCYNFIMTKLICSDFDRTIYFRDDEELTHRNFLAIQRWRHNGNIFAVATNRSFVSVKRQLPEFKNYFDYLILDSGSTIFNAEGEIFWSTTFSETTLEELFKITRELPEQPVITFFNATAEDFSFEPLEKMTKMRFWFKDYNNGLVSLDIVKTINEKTFLTKFDSLTDNKSVLGGYIAFLDIIPETAGKEVAADKLAEILGIEKGQVFTIGDGENDINMIRKFNGFAIKDSSAAKFDLQFNKVESLEKLIDEKIGE